MRHGAIRVLVVEDHQVVREGLRALLGAEPDIAIAGEAADGRAAIRAVAETAPDVVLMDIGLPGLDGVEAIRAIRAARPGAAVLVLSMHDDGHTVERALRAGARGYVLKGRGVAEVCEAIRRVHRGELCLADELSAHQPAGPAGAGPLSPREREIVGLVAEGYTSRQIAVRLGLAVKTVSNHRANIIEKLGVRTTADLVRYAIKAGLAR